MEADFGLFSPKGFFLGLTCKMPPFKFACGRNGHFFVRMRTVGLDLNGFQFW